MKKKLITQCYKWVEIYQGTPTKKSTWVQLGNIFTVKCPHKDHLIYNATVGRCFKVKLP